MSDDQLQAMFDVAAKGSQDDVRLQIERNSRLQGRARNTRWTLRIAILVLGAIGFSAAFFGESKAMGMTAGICFLLAIPCGAILFFMGGLAPSPYHTAILSDRERDLLNDGSSSPALARLQLEVPIDCGL